MKSKTILSADEMLEILNSQWATVQDIMKIGAVGRNKARDIKNKIEEQLQYPGTIKVTVIRETRAIEEAK